MTAGRCRRAAATLVVAVTPLLAVAAEPAATRLGALRQAQKTNARPAEIVKLGRDAIVEARAAGDDNGLRDALVATARAAMSADGFEAGMDVLRTERWPASVPAQALLHVLAADALGNQARLPDTGQGIAPARDPGRDQDERRRVRAFLARVTELESHLDAAWALRESLPLAPEDAFGPHYTYPERHVAETARDALTYATARILAKRDAWRGRDSIDRVSAAALLQPPRACPGDASVHPLVRAAAVLRDLEEWHLGAKRREAALRAARVAAQTLAGATWQDVQAAVIDAFAARLRRDRDLPTFSAGAADLASLLATTNPSLPENGARAHELRVEGAEAYPATEGARRCASALEPPRPSMALAGMSHDGPGKRSLCIRSNGLPEVHLAAFRIDAMAHLDELAGDRSRGAAELRRLVRDSAPVASWTVHPERPDDGKTHSTWVVPPLTKKGAYMVVASSRPDLAAEDALAASVTFVVTDLVLVATSTAGGRTEVVAMSGETGEPQPGVTVWRPRLRELTDTAAPPRLTTGNDGRVVLPPVTDYAPLIAATRGDDLAVARLPSEPDRSPHAAAMLVADRHRYRPGEQVRFLYLGTEPAKLGERPLPSTGTVISVVLVDGTGRRLRRLRPTTDAFGVAWGALTIPRDRPAGVWRIETEDEPRAEAVFEVFDDGGLRAQLAVPGRPVAPGERVTIRGKVTSAGIAAAAGAHVDWTLRTERLILDLGRAEVASDGTFELSALTPATRPRAGLGVEAWVASGPFRTFASAALATDESVILSGGFSASWTRVGEPVRLVATRRRGQVPAPGECRYRVVRLDPGAQAVMPGDAVHPGVTAGDRLDARFTRSEYAAVWTQQFPEAGVVAAGVTVHGADGVASVGLPDLAPGLYAAELTTAGDDGAVERASDRAIVLSSDGKVPFGAAWVVVPAADSAPAGAPWRLLIHCGFPGQLFFTEHYADGTRVSRNAERASRIASFPSRCDDPVRQELRFWFVRDFQLAFIDSPWVIQREQGGLDLAVTRGVPASLLVGVRDRDGTVLKGDRVRVLVMSAPPDDEVRDLFTDTPEPSILLPESEWPGELGTSLSKHEGVLLASPSRPYAPPLTATPAGSFATLLPWTVRDQEAVVQQAETTAPDGATPAEGDAIASDPLAFQPDLTPGADGTLRVKLPTTWPSTKLWIVAISRAMRYGFAEVSLDDPAAPPAGR